MKPARIPVTITITMREVLRKLLDGRELLVQSQTALALGRRGLVDTFHVSKGFYRVGLTPSGRAMAEQLDGPGLLQRVQRGASYTSHAVLAGAYAGKVPKLTHTLIHASADGGATAVCGRTSNLCDVEEPGPPTCARCCAWMRKHG